MTANAGSLKRPLSEIAFLSTLLLFSLNIFAADTLITPDNASINYYGRFDFSNPKAPRFNWSGTTIEILISGSTSVEMELTDGAGYYDIEVDGKAQSSPVYADSWSSKKYTIVPALSTGEHEIRIIRRNEPYWAIVTFGGIYLSSGAKVLSKVKPTRKMEFCGDSYTAGYFIEACDDQQAKTNTNKSWARLTSKAFKAQDIILAESGIGMVKSLGNKTCLPKKYMGTFDTVGGAATPVWNFSSWIPDIVTVFLGINDKSSGATDNEYTAGFHSFVTTIRTNYPTTPILFISYTDCMDIATKAAVVAETTSLGHKGVYFLECKQKINGCSWHPTVTDAKEISDSVIIKIKQITGWDTTTVRTIENSKLFKGTAQLSQIKAFPINNFTYLIFANSTAAGSLLKVLDAQGKTVEWMQLDNSGTCSWNTSRTPQGIYCIGSSRTGWTRVLIRD